LKLGFERYKRRIVLVGRGIDWGVKCPGNCPVGGMSVPGHQRPMGHGLL